MYMYFIFVLFLFFLATTSKKVKKIKSINLDTSNVLTIKGTIDEQSASQFIYELNKKSDKSSIYVYLDTNGGSVESGNKILKEIQKFNMSCIADRAYSMGFVLLQGCNRRYITNFSRLMQHQISYGLQNEKEKIENYVKYIDEIDTELNSMQAERLNMTLQDFKHKTLNEWWVFGKNALKHNMVDKVVNVYCSQELTHSNYTVTNHMYTMTYSRCPLISEPLEKS